MEKDNITNRIENTKKKSIKKLLQKKNMRNAISMALVCVLLMSGATYAWFTLSNTSKVEGLSLKVATEGNLQIKVEGGSYGEGIDWDMESSTVSLLPCTSKNATNAGYTFYKPVYSNDSTISGLNTISTDKDKYFLEKVIYLNMTDDATANTVDYAVTLAQTGTGTGDPIVYDGTYIKNTDGSASKCVRASFTVGDETAAKAIYEPNYDSFVDGDNFALPSNNLSIDGGGEIAKGEFGVYGTLLHKQNAENGIFEGYTGGTVIYRTDDSAEIFSLKNNTDTKVTIRVWFEGMDEDCANEIELKSIAGQFKFIAYKK